MNSILIRVTRNDGLKEDVLFNYLSKYKVIGVEEYPHENPHYHFWLKTDLKHDTVQKFIRDKCFVEGLDKKDRKFSVVSKEGNLKYMSKGPMAVSKIKAKDYPGQKVDPVICINTDMISDHDIISAHEEWWKEAKEFLEKKSKTVKVVKENQEKQSWFEILCNYVKVHVGIEFNDGWKVAEAIIRCYQDKLKCMPNSFQVRCYAVSVTRHLLYEYQQQNGGTAYDRYVKALAREIIGHEWVHVAL